MFKNKYLKDDYCFYYLMILILYRFDKEIFFLDFVDICIM